MKQETASRSCPACNERVVLERGNKNDYVLNSCRSCGTMFTARLPNAGDEQDYESYYRPERLAQSAPDFIATRLDEIVSTFSPYRQTDRLLDLGCGSGELLQAARRANWQAQGMEVSQPAAEYVRGMGFEVFHGELAQAEYSAHSFDVVTAFEVLEHLADPLDIMREVARILRPGGLFYATTPHGCSLSARLLGTRWSVVSPPEHLQLFSARGMTRLLDTAGFYRTKTATQGLNPYEIFHVLRHKSVHANKLDSAYFNRVQSSRILNESLTRSPARRMLKSFLNGLLNLSHLGDSLKICAVR